MPDSFVTSPAARLVRGGLADLAPRGVPGFRAVVRRALLRTLRAERPGTDHRVDVHAGDPGLTGPGSASWRVQSDVAGLPAGVRALLLQALHPLAVAGVSDHSGYRDDQWGRLHRTGAWVATSTFGAVPDVLQLARIVRAQHRKVRGTAPDGRPYAADDPDLLAWVSLTFTDSLLTMDRALAAHPVGDTDADRFVLEQSRIGALLDPRVDLDALDTPTGHARLRSGEVDLPLLDDGLLPHDVDSMRSALLRYRHDLGVGDQGQEILDFLDDPGIGAAATPAYRILHGAAVASLPDWLRRHVPGRRTGVGNALALARADALLTTMRLGLGSSPARAAAEERVLAS